MPKSTEQLAASKGGSTAETNGMGSAERGFRPDGVYQLKDEDGKVVSQIIVKNHPLFGDAQAAAVERVGFKFLREATADDIKTFKVGPSKQETDKADDIKGILARLDAAEKRNEELEAKLAEAGTGDAGGVLPPEGTGNSALDDADDDGDDEEEGDEDGDEDGDSEEETPTTPEKPLTKDNYNEAELREIAAAEGVELTDEHSTKQKIVDAIKAVREAKKGE